LLLNNAVTVLPSETPDHRLQNTQDVSNLLADSINQVLRGQLDPKVANSVGYLATVMLRSLEQGRPEQGVAGAPVLGSTFRERFKSMWLLAEENKMRQVFEAEAAAANKLPDDDNPDD
jgi:hypothetical protein